jgi:hypothetical protein
LAVGSGRVDTSWVLAVGKGSVASVARRRKDPTARTIRNRLSVGERRCDHSASHRTPNGHARLPTRASLRRPRAFYIFKNDIACLHADVMRTLSCPSFELLRLTRSSATQSHRSLRETHGSRTKTRTSSYAARTTRGITPRPSANAMCCRTGIRAHPRRTTRGASRRIGRAFGRAAPRSTEASSSTQPPARR